MHEVSAPWFLCLTVEAMAAGWMDDAFIDATCEPLQMFTIGGMIAHVLILAVLERGLVMLVLCWRDDDMGMGRGLWGLPLAGLTAHMRRLRPRYPR